MSKNKNLAITQSASMAGRALAALNAQGEKIAKELANGNDRSLQLVSGKSSFSALIKSGRTTIQIEGEDFAVSHRD